VLRQQHPALVLFQQGAGPGYCSGKQKPGDEAVCFGCRLGPGISRKVNARDSWIQFGTLSAKRDSFRVNKAAILQTLEEQMRADGCLFCPAFRWQHVRTDVDDLPEVIELGKDSLFEVKTSALNPKKALGIQPKKTPIDLGLTFRLDTAAKAAEPAPGRNVPTVRYADIAGQDTALEQLKNVVELPLTHQAYFEALRVEPQSGVLLYGPPGNGKTLLAKAVATESNAHFELISGPEILSKWVGESEANLRKLFARARQLAPSVVLIDELDSIAVERALIDTVRPFGLATESSTMPGTARNWGNSEGAHTGHADGRVLPRPPSRSSGPQFPAPCALEGSQVGSNP
jgi:hypothetical protein